MKLGYLTAILTFLTGTIIFSAYYFTSSDILLLIGYCYIALALIANIFILSIIVSKRKRDKNKSKSLSASILIMLLNIPVILCYCWFTIVLLNTMRITFTNSTNTTIKDLNIIGCKKEHIDELEIGESKTIWISITGDCAINIDYLTNKEKKYESVTGYLTSNMGGMKEYEISLKNR